MSGGHKVLMESTKHIAEGITDRKGREMRLVIAFSVL